MFTAALVLIFILRLRFPSRIPFTSTLRTRYGLDTLKLYRRYEKILLKLEKNKCDLSFLNSCKSYEVIPRFLQFKLYRKNLTNSKLYRSWQFKLLNMEIRQKHRNIKRLQEQSHQLLSNLKLSVLYIDFNCISCKVNSFIDKQIITIKQKQARKLSNLGVNNSLQPLDPNRVIHNFSDRQLTTREQTLLAYGLNFKLPIFKLDFFNYFLSFEKIHQQLKKEPTVNKNNQASLKAQLHNLAFKYFYSFKPQKVFSPIFSRSDFKILKSISQDKSITICRPDKGQGIVIMNRTDYVRKVETILSDRSKFTAIEHNNLLLHTLHQEDKVNRLIGKLKKENVLSESTASNLTVSGTSPGTMYGLPKIHKSNWPIRPILSANNTSTYNISKYLLPLLEPLTINQYTVKNSFSFVNNLCNINNTNHLIMSSFDIESLFTQIPLQETIDIILEKLFSDCDKFHNFNKTQFKSLLDLATKNSFFLFNNVLYKQIDGVAMGSPLGPTLANIFLCHHEKLWLAECPSDFKPKYYKRYVDDTFLLFDNISKIQPFSDYMNSKHSNIKFTYEIESNNSISFLDILINNTNNKFVTSIYRKPTFTGLGMNYLSSIPQLFKVNSIRTLIYRAYHLSSSYLNFHKEVEFLQQYFKNNNFPVNLFQKHLKSFLHKIYNPSPIVHTVDKRKMYISLPYYGYISEKIRSELDSIILKMFPHLNVKLAFNNSFSIKSFFKHKESLPAHVCSSVIYLYKCEDCSSSYIGSTIRQFQCRQAEHMNVSVRTGLPLASPNHSAILQHSKSTGHGIFQRNFKILNKTHNKKDIRTLESLYITKTRPNLNTGVPVDLDVFSF